MSEFDYRARAQRFVTEEDRDLWALISDADLKQLREVVNMLANSSMFGNDPEIKRDLENLGYVLLDNAERWVG